MNQTNITMDNTQYVSITPKSTIENNLNQRCLGHWEYICVSCITLPPEFDYLNIHRRKAND